MTTKLDTLHSQLAGALRRAQKLHTEALPKFNWGASALDAHAIQLLNEVPGDVAAALAQYDAAAAQQAAHTFHVEPTPVLAQGSVTLTLQLTPEWVDSVLCTAIESADYGWFDWTDIVQGRDPELPSIPTYVSGTCTEYDPDEGTPVDGAQPVLVDAAKLAEGVQKLLEGTVGVGSQYLRDLFQSVATMDAGLVDADLADCIVQAAVLGEIRYG